MLKKHILRVMSFKIANKDVIAAVSELKFGKSAFCPFFCREWS